jgi:hypothetical protein
MPGEPFWDGNNEYNEQPSGWLLALLITVVALVIIGFVWGN